MSIQKLSRDEVARHAVAMLGLDETVVDLDSSEGLCASIRRAASFLCPASPRKIVDAVLDVAAPLGGNVEREDVVTALNVLVSSGDMLELGQASTAARMLFLGPPSYIEKRPGQFLLIGIRPNAEAILDEESLDLEVVYEGHTRSVLLPMEAAAETLGAAGLHRLTREQWTRSPRQESSAGVVEQARARVVAAHAPGQVSGLTIIDSASSVRYYKGRWREPVDQDDGIFVGRRPQTYGASIWCLVELAGGVPQGVLDLPIDSAVAPGWDEARRVQAALDAERGVPQIYRLRASGHSEGTSVVDFFGPLPSWAERYLELTGLPVSNTQGALFSYRVPEEAMNEATVFLSKSLWMTATEESQGK